MDGVKRLLSNHYLDLDSWTAVRFWPRREDFSQDLDLDVAAGIVARDLSAFMRAVADEFKVGISLTAGYDTRILLAAARAVVHRVEAFGPRRLRRSGAASTRRASWRSAGRWRTRRRPRTAPVPLLPASDARPRSRRGLMRSGRMRSDRGQSRLLGADGCAALDYDAFTLSPGCSGSLGGHASSTGTIGDARICGSPRLDAGGGPSGAKLEMNPIAQRSIRRAFLSVLPEEKGTEALFRRSIALMWPELLDFPVNRFGNYRDALSKASKLFQPGRLRRHLRARLS
jgi:hypothetical protein